MELRNGKKITINSTLKLEPYITVPKDILFNLKRIDEKRIKEIVSYDCHGHLYTALLCYKYPMTDYGYKNTRSFLERFAKISSKIDLIWPAIWHRMVIRSSIINILNGL